MDTEVSFESTNINAKWLDNIYENLKNLEALERTTREGCVSLVEYLGIPRDIRAIEIGEAQYKCLKQMVTEFHLLLTDLTPVMNEKKLQDFRTKVNALALILTKRKLFLEERKDRNGNLIAVEVNAYFLETLEAVATIKRDIIKQPEVSSILYVRRKDPNEW